MDSKHTPGPWSIRWFEEGPSKRRCFIVQAPNKASVVEQRYPFDWDAARANARLIATAPELLEALRNLRDCFAPHCSDPLWPIWKAACDAIAKAEPTS